MIYKFRSTFIFLVLSVLTTFSAIGQKPTVYYNVTKLHESTDYYYGYKFKTTVSYSKKKGQDTTSISELYGLYASTDTNALFRLIKTDFKDNFYKIDNEHYIVVSFENKKGLIHLESGKLIIPFIYSQIYYIDEDNVFICKSKNGGNLHNLKGEKINTISYKDLKLCYIGYYDGIQTGSNAKVYNIKNEVLVDFGAAKIIEETFYENNYIIEKEGKYGIVNEKNEIKLPFNYSKIEYKEGEFGEYYIASKTQNKVTLQTVIKPQEDGNWKEVLPLDFTYISEFEIYNNSDSPFTHTIKEALYYGINSQNKGVFMDNSGKILFTLEDAPKIYQASLLEDKFIQAYIDYSDYSILYSLENGKLILGEGYYYQGKMPAPFDNFLYFTNEVKNNGTCFLNTVNYSTYFVDDYVYDFGMMKPDFQAIYCSGDFSSHLLLFDLEKNIIRKQYSLMNFTEPDLIWWQNFDWIVAQDDNFKKGSVFIYDLMNDTLIYNGLQTHQAYRFALSKFSKDMDRDLISNKPLMYNLVNLPHLKTIQNEDKTFTVYIDNDSIIIPYLTKKIEFEWLDFSNAYMIGTSVSINSNVTGNSYIYSSVLDDRLNVVMPFQEGYVVNVVPNLHGSIIALQFGEDSVHYYNTATKKTLYFSSIYTALKIKSNPFYIFDWMPFANHLIIYEKGFNYIMDYTGKILIKAKELNYENVGNNYLIEHADGGTELTFLPSLVTAQVGEGMVQEYGTYPFVFVKNEQEYYGLYDAQTGKTVINHDIKSFSTFLIKETIWIQNKEGKFAIYNLNTNSIGKGYIFESEEAALLEMYGE